MTASFQQDRKLVAIMVADLVQFSRLMEAAESATFARVQRAREELIGPSLSTHSGRLIKTTGDGFLAEFQSATAAVKCGIDLQRGFRRAEVADVGVEPLRLRIGINLADVLSDGADVAGDGVNVAARLESMAPPGGICISGAVFDQLRENVGVEFHDLGPRQLKNISRSIRVFSTQSESESSRLSKPQRARKAIALTAAALALGLGIAGVAYWPPTGSSQAVERDLGEFAGKGTFSGGKVSDRPFSLRLAIRAEGSNVRGTYTDDADDRGTVHGRMDGNSLHLDQVSNRVAGRCSLQASIGSGGGKLVGIYRCPDGEHGEFALERVAGR